MEIALSPMEFARRARRIYANCEAVVDGDLRLSYAEFFERCDRWSAALQAMGIGQGDRVAYIAPNTHAHILLLLVEKRKGRFDRWGFPMGIYHGTSKKEGELEKARNRRF